MHQRGKKKESRKEVIERKKKKPHNERYSRK